MKSMLRVIVFLIFTGGSFLGLLVPFVFLISLADCCGINDFTSRSKEIDFSWVWTFYVFLCFICSTYAWLIYFHMGLSWIAKEIVSKKWIIRGTVSALISLSPIFVLEFYSTLSDFKGTLGVILVTVGSAIFFASYLVFYHLKGNKNVNG